MPRLTNSPQETTNLELEARKSFSFGLWLRNPNGSPVDLTDCVLTLVAARIGRLGEPTVVVDRTAELVQPTDGYARFNLQAADLDLRAGTYPFTVTLRHQGYSAALLKGQLTILPNVELASAEETYQDGSPPQSLLVTLRDKHDIHLELSTMVDPGAKGDKGDKGDDSIVPGPIGPARTWETLEGKPATFPPAEHAHDWSAILGKPLTFASTWDEVADKPLTFPPAQHGHTLAEIAAPQIPSTDLDTLTTAGYYDTGSTLNGTLANNFPVAGIAGLLEVVTGPSHAVQRLTERAPGTRTWQRTKFNANPWSAWREFFLELPDPLRKQSGTTTTVTAGLGVWQDIPGATNLTFGNLTRPLLVRAVFGAQASASSGYTMIGVHASGALNMEPERDEAGALSYDWTPFRASTVDSSISGSKTFLLPVGTTNLRLRGRRSVASGTHTVNYSYLELIPLKWK